MVEFVPDVIYITFHNHLRKKKRHFASYKCVFKAGEKRGTIDSHKIQKEMVKNIRLSQFPCVF